MWRCPSCGKITKQIVSRRKLRINRMRSRTNRRMGTKSGDSELPKKKLQRLIEQARESHMEGCNG